MSVQKILFNTDSPKQLYIPSNPLLASFSGYVAETQCCQGFCEIKTTGRSVSKNDFAEILARQGFGDFQKIKLREKFCCN